MPDPANWTEAIGCKYNTRGGRMAVILTGKPLTARTPDGYIYTYSQDGRCEETTAADLMELDRSTNQGRILTGEEL
jgi:hypothetical protein